MDFFPQKKNHLQNIRSKHKKNIGAEHLMHPLGLSPPPVTQKGSLKQKAFKLATIAGCTLAAYTRS